MFSGLCHEDTRATLDTNGFTSILRNRGDVNTLIHKVKMSLTIILFWPSPQIPIATSCWTRSGSDWSKGNLRRWNRLTKQEMVLKLWMRTFLLKSLIWVAFFLIQALPFEECVTFPLKNWQFAKAILLSLPTTTEYPDPVIRSAALQWQDIQSNVT